MTPFEGAWAALLTPFMADGQVNLTRVRDLVDFQLDKGTGGFYLNGTTGSGLFLTVDERKQVTEAVMAQVQGRVPVIVHVGSVSVQDAVALAVHARDQSVNGISSIIPPAYTAVDSLDIYYRTIAAAVPETPLLPYIFNAPVNGFDMMVRLLDISSVVGTKYTGPDMFEFKRIADLKTGDWSVFSGMDEQCVFAAMSGSCGNIGSTLNYMPVIYQKMRAYVDAGEYEEAMRLQNQANAVTAVMASDNFWGAMYEAMRLIGFDCGQPRLPYRPMSEAALPRFREALDGAGFDAVTGL